VDEDRKSTRNEATRAGGGPAVDLEKSRRVGNHGGAPTKEGPADRNRCAKKSDLRFVEQARYKGRVSSLGASGETTGARGTKNFTFNQQGQETLKESPRRKQIRG